MANYGYEVFILPEQYTKNNKHSDTITNNEFLDLKNLTTKNVNHIGEKFTEAKKQGQSVFIYLHEDFENTEVVDEINWRILNDKKINKENIN